MSRRKKRRENKQRGTQQAHPSLQEHKRKGKSLIPPLLDVPNLAFTSWMNERLPEMLWAALLVTNLKRKDALALFRKVAEYAQRFESSSESVDITHSGLQRLDADSRKEILEIISFDPDAKKALRPVLLLKELPSRDVWQDAINDQPHSEDWNLLAAAAARTLDHQSEESTDCRWMRVLFQLTAGRIKFLQKMAETVKGLLYYPNYGDLRRVRPSIRAMEGGLAGILAETESEWAPKFWAQCLTDTPCIGASNEANLTLPKVGTTVTRLNETYEHIVDHGHATRQTSAVDPKHDTVFGTVLYCLSILRELLGVGLSQSILGRMALRTLVESYITLAYLVKKDDPKLWQSYRVFGAGQAKLALLHLDRFDEKPGYVNMITLEDLANEDLWQEFLPINLGHWEKSNLRSSSEKAGVKNDYDRFYPWTSAYLHGHWGAIRDSVFETCRNPLHRLHRIPRTRHRALDDVLSDACYLVDKMLALLDSCYPQFPYRVTEDEE